MEKVNIEELIADARAEEEVSRKQTETFKEEIARKLKEKNPERKAEALVSVPLSEYLDLYQKSVDYARFLTAIENSLEYSEIYKTLVVRDRDSDVMNCFKLLYPGAYAEIFEEERIKVEAEKAMKEG